jgi:hypothetical protein
VGFCFIGVIDKQVGPRFVIREEAINPFVFVKHEEFNLRSKPHHELSTILNHLSTNDHCLIVVFFYCTTLGF